MAERIYLVGGTCGFKLVRATSRASAIAHVVKSNIYAELASQEDLVERLLAGDKVENSRPENLKIDLEGTDDVNKA